MTKIIHETSEHFAAVRKLTIDAFLCSDLGHNGEAGLVESVREQCREAISLVAIDGPMVVGHILFSPPVIRTSTSVMNGMGLAPMSVLPTRQRSGIGAMLVKEGLRQVHETDAMFTLVAGHPEYFPKFGFRPARDYSVTHGFEGVTQDILFVHLCRATIATQLENGLAFFHDVFGTQHGG